jgi:hypothetical protein
MSIEFTAYLGSDINNLDSKVISCFSDLGFDVTFHPEMSLQKNNRTECFAIAINKTPEYLKRNAKDTPLFTSFGYVIAKIQDKKYIPKKARKCTYGVYTRTSAGRTRATCLMQELTTAILAKVTQGIFYGSEQEQALNGDDAVKYAVDELHKLESRALYAIDQLKLLEKDRNAIPSSIAFYLDMSDPAFDFEATPFNGWPDLDAYCSYTFKKSISSRPVEFNHNPEPEKRKSLQEKIDEIKWTIFNLFRQ